MSCGAETEANRLLLALTAGEDFALPEVDMSNWDIPGGDNSPIFAEVPRITNESLTTREVGGSGVFDALMESASKHLKAEFKENRITGGEYTKAYIATLEACMGNAVQFLLGRDSAYFQAALAQIQAVTARVGLATAKAQFVLAKVQALTTKSEYALTKLKLSNESQNYCAALFNLDNILPAQERLLQEQYEVQRAQTQDNRSDALPVRGSIGKQKDLYDQQITSYKRDSEVKAAKLFTDAWITQKTIDEGLVPPDGFTNDQINPILMTLKSNNNLG
ncbi:virion structural protein [Klebsiella phage VLCpiP4a]|nr:virion structural protein [Klebsiella phage VLCpiP4a]